MCEAWVERAWAWMELGGATVVVGRRVCREGELSWSRVAAPVVEKC